MGKWVKLVTLAMHLAHQQVFQRWDAFERQTLSVPKLVWAGVVWTHDSSVLQGPLHVLPAPRDGFSSRVLVWNASKLSQIVFALGCRWLHNLLLPVLTFRNAEGQWSFIYDPRGQFAATSVPGEPWLPNLKLLSILRYQVIEWYSINHPCAPKHAWEIVGKWQYSVVNNQACVNFALFKRSCSIYPNILSFHTKLCFRAAKKQRIARGCTRKELVFRNPMTARKNAISHIVHHFFLCWSKSFWIISFVFISVHFLNSFLFLRCDVPASSFVSVRLRGLFPKNIHTSTTIDWPLQSTAMFPNYCSHPECVKGVAIDSNSSQTFWYRFILNGLEKSLSAVAFVVNDNNRMDYCN